MSGNCIDSAQVKTDDWEIQCDPTRNIWTRNPFFLIFGAAGPNFPFPKMDDELVGSPC